MFKVTVPATLSNLGPGYDVFGLAVALHNDFLFEPAKKVEIVGYGGNLDQHLTWRTLCRACDHFELPRPTLRLKQVEAVPRARGLGSSATARIAGALAALHFANQRVSDQQLLDFLIEEEGHPDNVSAALYGGLTLCAQTQHKVLVRRVKPAPFRVVLAVPDFEVKTDEARKKMPATHTHSAVVHNLGWLAFVLHGLVSGDEGALRAGLFDNIHQPYRAPLCGDVHGVFEAAKAAGAIGSFISGSGSTLASFTTAAHAQAVSDAMAEAYNANAFVVDFTTVGPRVYRP